LSISTKKGKAPSEAIQLAKLLMAYAPHDGSFPLGPKGLYAIRRASPYKGLVRDVQKPAMCIVAQGSKTATLGNEAFEYNAANLIVFAVNVPLAFQITQASAAMPFLCLKMDLDPHRIADLVLKVFPHGLPKQAEGRAVILSQSDPKILRAAIRLMEMMARPGEAELLTPLALEEILIRLLRGPMGPQVAQMGFAKSGVHGIAKAVSWLCESYAQPIKVDELARVAGMSLSTFHHHFKAVTTMSPVQYQKELRLQEARRLMLSKMMDVGSASQQVGYLSASQFSREYGRLFGNPPSRDIARLREQTEVFAGNAGG
jgi:AraC-like DNA-binding protein